MLTREVTGWCPVRYRINEDETETCGASVTITLTKNIAGVWVGETAPQCEDGHDLSGDERDDMAADAEWCAEQEAA